MTFKKHQQQVFGAELTKLAYEVLPVSEEKNLLPPKGGIKARHMVLINVFKGPIPLITSAESLLHPAIPWDTVTLWLTTYWTWRDVVQDSANLLYSTLNCSSNKAIDQNTHWSSFQAEAGLGFQVLLINAEGSLVWADNQNIHFPLNWLFEETKQSPLWCNPVEFTGWLSIKRELSIHAALSKYFIVFTVCHCFSVFCIHY